MLGGHGNKGEDMELGGRAEEGGAGAMVEVKGKGRWESTVHFLSFFQIGVWCTIINLVHHKAHHIYIYTHNTYY